jgi:putative membrane protein
MSATIDQLTAGTSPKLDDATRLALKRTQLAVERTLMAWVRTAFSMITFGFTIGKFIEYLGSQSDARLPLGSGLLLPKLMVLIGLVSLTIGIWEHRHALVKLADVEGRKHRVTPLGIIASLVALLGVAAFAGLFVSIDFF